jgi:hypothetical protein
MTSSTHLDCRQSLRNLDLKKIDEKKGSERILLT